MHRGSLLLVVLIALACHGRVLEDPLRWRFLAPATVSAADSTSLPHGMNLTLWLRHPPHIWLYGQEPAVVGFATAVRRAAEQLQPSATAVLAWLAEELIDACKDRDNEPPQRCCRQEVDVVRCYEISPAQVERRFQVPVSLWEHKRSGKRQWGTFEDLPSVMGLAVPIEGVTGVRLEVEALLPRRSRKFRAAPDGSMSAANNHRDSVTRHANTQGGSASSSSSVEADAPFPAPEPGGINANGPLVVDVTFGASQLHAVSIALRCADGTLLRYLASSASLSCAAPTTAVVAAYTSVPTNLSSGAIGGAVRSQSLSISVDLSDVSASSSFSGSDEVCRLAQVWPFRSGLSDDANVVVCRLPLYWTLPTYVEHFVTASLAFSSGAVSPQALYKNIAPASDAEDSELSLLNPIGVILVPYTTPQALLELYSVTDVTTTCSAQSGGWRPTVGVVEFEQQDNPTWSTATLQSDVSQFATQIMGQSGDSSSVSVFGTLSAAPQDETELDVQMVVGLCPTVQLHVICITSFQEWLQQLVAAQRTDSEPQVYSVSWGWSEDAVVKSRCDRYFRLLGAAGITFTVSAGDQGGMPGAQWPAESPHVLAVGATALRTSSAGEVVCSAGDSNVITSGGGFSTTFAAPTYQSTCDAISEYVSSGNAPSSTGNARGYPDVAAIGASLVTVQSGEQAIMYGTSASSPIVAGLIARVNVIRRLVGQPASLGLPHSLLYNTSNLAALGVGNTVFRDVTAGDNCRGEQGQYPFAFPSGQRTVNCYPATAGWDAVSGWGSLNYSALLLAAANYTAPISGPDDGGATATSSSLGGAEWIVIALFGGLAGLAILSVIIVKVFCRRQKTLGDLRPLAAAGPDESWMSTNYIRTGART